MLLRVMLILVLSFSILFAKADDILGKWFTESSSSKVEIYYKNNEYKGKIVWLKEPIYDAKHAKAGKEKADDLNPDEKKKNAPLVGLDFLWGFKYNESEKKWINGTIYNPEDGKTYYCTLQFNKDGNLIVHGSVDAWGLLGKTQIWVKVTDETAKAE